MAAEPTWRSPAVIRRDDSAKRRARLRLWQIEAAPDRPRQAYLFAIVDAARDRRIYPGLKRFSARHEILPLYQGPTATDLAAVGPYLVCLGRTDELFDWLWDNGWGDNWGVFMWSLVSTENLRSHFRRHTMVRTSDGERLVFRFYDPRVMLPFLPTCDAAQLREFFGPVQQFMLEADGGAALVTLRRQPQGLVSQTLRLDEV